MGEKVTLGFKIGGSSLGAIHGEQRWTGTVLSVDDKNVNLDGGQSIPVMCLVARY